MSQRILTPTDGSATAGKPIAADIEFAREGRATLRYVACWGAISTALNLTWEIVQLPLYTLFREANLATIAYAVAHCTVGDVMIALASYGVAAITTQTWRWPITRPILGAVAAVPTGLVYTAFSEWLNVYVRHSWEYAPAMPTLYGIGVSPMLQWLVLPPIAVFLVRKVPM